MLNSIIADKHEHHLNIDENNMNIEKLLKKPIKMNNSLNYEKNHLIIALIMKKKLFR